MPRPMSTLLPKAPSTTMHPAGAQSSSSVNGMQPPAPATWSKTVRETSSHQAASNAAAKPTATFDGRTKPVYAATNADWPGPFIIDPKAPEPGFSVSSATTSGGCTFSFPRPTGTTPGLPSYREIVPPPVFRGNSANDFIFPAVPMPKVKQFASQINTVVSVDIPEWPMGVVMETRNVGVFEFSS
ncbi:hypothetical protein H4R99_007555 [Coemansia sp. RSA 1722]|nr:hypothetical protein H4R99_007555 [Coemansia sp. RSA 1722]